MPSDLHLACFSPGHGAVLHKIDFGNSAEQKGSQLVLKLPLAAWPVRSHGSTYLIPAAELRAFTHTATSCVAMK